MRKPMTVDPLLTSECQHAAKSVRESRLLDDMTDTSNFELLQRDNAVSRVTAAGEAGPFARFEAAQREGRPVMRLTSAVMSGPPNEATGRGWGSATLRRRFPDEDWTSSNRVSFEVYPDLPGFRVVSLCVYLYNEGRIVLPDHEVREGLHFIVLRNQEWNLCTWEFPELCRDRVTGLGFEYRLQGAEPGACETVTYDFTNLRLESVEADRTKGWEPKDGEIVFSHIGYAPGAGKTALAKGLHAKEYRLIRAEDGHVAYRGRIAERTTDIGTYQILDFTAFETQGRYFIQAGDVVTRPFSISSGLWRRTVEKVVNSFYCLRCGFPVPGIHDVCHQDLLARHGGASKVINGGWHDAGDLSQGIVNTAEAAYAMMALSESLRDREPELCDLLLEEARWGQDWVLKTRFTDGYRASWMTMDYWTDGVFGTVDDTAFDATRTAYDNFICAASEALAARFFAAEDPAFAWYNLEAAKEDFGFAAQDATADLRLDVYAQAVLAAVELYNTTREDAYLQRAVEYARVVMACQQAEYTDWAVPMRGFFYTTPERNAILHYPHRGHEQAPMVALCKLHRLVPEHQEAPAWMACIERYAQYVKGIITYTAPYFMLPASIYDLEEIAAENARASFAVPPERAVAQIKQGVPLDDTHYLRRFPVWHTFRGNSGTTLSMARGVLECAVLLGDDALLEICRRQLEWHVGRNPFNQSLIWGEGYHFTPQYTATSGNIVGTLPVGVETQGDEDVPYLPDANCYNYKEVWVHPASRWLWLMEYLYE